ncbi:CYFA0S01e01508g1_1 [Cyberlindnera fabianii]|uniref:CYFA0S01e01508g1_1 n=1 Tax=Cyberlindnera fabianii TaxID=36022 RepID=A0A061AFZ8_CYBFA|nr:CYFA0S01e01508g1_1 [Cyberlindnera fabianii]
MCPHRFPFLLFLFPFLLFFDLYCLDCAIIASPLLTICFVVPDAAISTIRTKRIAVCLLLFCITHTHIKKKMSDKILKHLSDRALNREIVAFHGLPIPDNVVRHDSPISLSGGRPHYGFYPVTKISYEFLDEPFGEKTTSVEFNRLEPDHEAKLDLKRALNYGPTQGHSQLVKFCKELLEFTSKPGYDDWDLTLTNGSGDSLHKVFNLLVNPGDVVLMECYTFVPVIHNIKAWGGEVVPVAMNFDDGGLDADALESLLENWSTGPYKEKPLPKALYTIPTGQNPTGLTLTEEKRKKVYELAQKYDFMIIEDDPYGMIQLGKYTDGVENPFTPGSYTAESFVKERLPRSYINLDTEGRVLRLETFSKVFAPGTRTGYISGHSSLIKQIIKHANCSTRAASGISQATLLAAIDKFGGAKGWVEWCIKVSKTYTDRKNVFLKTLFSSDAYKKGYFSVREPKAGMFITVELNFPEGDDHRLELEELNYKCVERGVEVVLGKNMAFTPEYAKSAKFLRLTVATQEDDAEIVEAASRLANSFSDYFDQ